MKTFAAILMLLTMPADSFHSEVIDRIVAVVNQQLITLGDVEREKKFLELGMSEELAATGQQVQEKSQQFKVVLHLIEQSLMREQILSFPGNQATDEEVEEQVESLQRKVGGSERWEQTLNDLRLTPEEIKSRLAWQIQVLKFFDSRFRSFVVVVPKEIEDYFNQVLLPELARKGGKSQPALTEVEEQIRQILVEEKLNKEINEWLNSLRQSAAIEIYD